MIHPWPILRSKPAGDYRIFNIRSETRRSPRTGTEQDFYLIDCTHWVNVIAVTADGRLVMIEQFRHGSNTVELEIPGGMMDAHEHSPVESAVRELREETGYEGRDPVLIGDIFPNPAIMTNVCHTVLVEGCEQRHPTALDHGEDIETRLVAPGEIPSLIVAGRIKHSLVVVALFRYELWKRGFRAAPSAG